MPDGNAHPHAIESNIVPLVPTGSDIRTTFWRNSLPAFPKPPPPPKVQQTKSQRESQTLRSNFVLRSVFAQFGAERRLLAVLSLRCWGPSHKYGLAGTFKDNCCPSSSGLKIPEQKVCVRERVGACVAWVRMRRCTHVCKYSPWM